MPAAPLRDYFKKYDPIHPTPNKPWQGELLKDTPSSSGTRPFGLLFDRGEITPNGTPIWEWLSVGNARPHVNAAGEAITAANGDPITGNDLRPRDVRSLLPHRGFGGAYSPAGGGDLSMDPGSHSAEFRGENFTWNGGVNHTQNHVWNGDINITETVIYEGDIDVNVTHRFDVSQTIDLEFDWTGGDQDPADPVTQFDYEAPLADQWAVNYMGGDITGDSFTGSSGHPWVSMEAAYDANDGADSLITQGQQLAFVLASREALADFSIVGDNYLGSQVTEVTAAEGYVSAGISNLAIDQWQHSTLGGAQFGGSTPVLGALVDVTTGDVLDHVGQLNT